MEHKDENSDYVCDREDCKAELCTSHTEETMPAKEATCTEAGLTAGVKCSVCGKILTAQEVVPANGHTEVVDEAVAATCTATGLTAGKHCSVCNEVLIAQETVDALGHTEVIDAAVAATCTATGLTAGKHCSVCEAVLVAQETVDALGHTEVIDAAVAATCTATGLTEGKHCSVCEAVLVEQEVVSALGHTEVVDEAVAATCTATGLTEGKHCSVCKEVIVAQEVVSALGHTEVVDSAVAPTCTATGLTEGKHCSVCDEVLVAQSVVPTIAHNFSNDKCTVCGVERKSYVISEYAAGTQYAENEVHKMDGLLTITTTQAHFTSEIRLYSSSTYNAYAILETNAVSQMIGLSINAGNKDDTLNVYGSNDGIEWVLISGISVTSAYKDYSINSFKYQYLKLDVKGTQQIRIKSITIIYLPCEHDYNSGIVTAPTCTEKGYTTYTCSVCGCNYADDYVDATGHDFTDTTKETCANCEEPNPNYNAGGGSEETQSIITFKLGDDGSAAHADGSTDNATYSETNNGYTLSITGGSKMYPGSKDATGNGALKFGSSSAAGKFTLSVPEDVTKVIIYVAGYKTSTAKITVNGKSYTITTLSNNGDYTAIEVDTSTTKTVTFTTVSGGYRCMVNTIEFYVTSSGGSEPACEHTNKVAIGEPKDATCTEPGITAGSKCDDCEEVLVAQEEIPATGHDFTDTTKETCANCEEPNPNYSVGGGETVASTVKYTFSSYAAGTQYATGEVHDLGNGATLTINGAHLNTQVRLYSGSNAVIEANGTISEIIVKAGYKVATLNVYESNDGITWTLVKAITTTTAYTEYTVEIDNKKYIKLESVGAQIRVSELTINPQ